MKTNKFLLGAFALLATGVMASCSNDEPAINNGGNTDQVGDKYMAVRISMPTMMGTRAEDDYQLADGTNKVFESAVNNESKIEKENVRFYFYTSDYQPFTLVQTNVNGTVEETNMVTPQELKVQDQDGNVTYEEGVLVLGTPTAPYVGKTPKYVVCAINLSETRFKSIANKTMNAIEEIQTIKSAESDGTYSWNTFAMSSSTYANKVDAGDGKGEVMRKVIASEIKEGMLASSIDAAKSNPVNIYVERIASKVRVKGLDTYTSMAEDGNEATYTIIGQEGTRNVKLKVELTGWQLRNRYMYANIFKYIDKNATDDDYFPNWNDPSYHRSYWAVTPTEDSYLVNKDYDIYSSEQFRLGNFNADDDNLKNNFSYTYPSTAWQPASSYQSKGKTIEINPQINRDSKATAVVVKGVVKEVKEDGTVSEDGLDLVYWAGGYYDLEAFKQMVINAYNTKNEANLSSTAVKFKSTGNNLNQAYVQAGEVNDDVENRFVDVSYWRNGITSYYINIKHATKKDGTPLFGLVRNHIYENNISGVVGLGVPGNDPKNPEDETESYLACTINVLNWRVISDNVVLGK